MALVERWVTKGDILLGAVVVGGAQCGLDWIPYRPQALLFSPYFSSSHFNDWINGAVLLTAADIMKSPVNQWHYSSSYLVIESASPSGAKDPAVNLTFWCKYTAWCEPLWIQSLDEKSVLKVVIIRTWWEAITGIGKWGCFSNDGTVA